MADRKRRRWGSVTKLKGGGYRVRYTALDGRRRQKTLPTSELAEDFLAKMKLEIQRERIHGPASRVKPILLRDYVPIFLKRREATGAAENTLVAYKGSLAEFARHLGDRHLHEITVRELERVRDTLYVTGRYGRRRSHRTVMSIFVALSAMLTMACVDGYAEKNVARSVKLTRPDAKEKYIMSDEERRKLLASAHPDFRDALELAFETGMRTSEIMALNCRQIRLESPPYGEIFVEKSKARNQRLVPMTKNARRIVRKLMAEAGPDGAMVPFNKRDGRWRRLWVKSLSAAQLKRHLVFHDTRHHYAVEVLEAENPVQSLAANLGTTVETALGYAKHTRNNYRALSVKRVEAYRKKRSRRED